MAGLRRFRPYHRALWLVASLLITGCATISGGTQEVVTIISTPSGATVKTTVDGKEVEYTTPTGISFSRGEDHVITIEKKGYKTATVQLPRKFRGWSTIGGNVLWLLPGVIVDGVSGSWYEFKEKTVRVTLELEGDGPAIEPPAAAPTIVSPAQLTYGILLASYESRDQALLGSLEIWGKHPQILSGIQSAIMFGSFEGAQDQHHVYGEGLTNEQAIDLCERLQQQNEYCKVVQL